MQIVWKIEKKKKIIWKIEWSTDASSTDYTCWYVKINEWKKYNLLLLLHLLYFSSNAFKFFFMPLSFYACSWNSSKMTELEMRTN